jgi:hypothetical protein
MKDRYGDPIRVGWSDHHIVWLEAAMTLSGEERDYAIQDIGELTGRSPEAVRAKMRAINWKRRQALMGHRAVTCAQAREWQSKSVDDCLAALEGRE